MNYLKVNILSQLALGLKKNYSMYKYLYLLWKFKDNTDILLYNNAIKISQYSTQSTCT